jgi:hypothetical protein
MLRHLKAMKYHQRCDSSTNSRTTRENIEDNLNIMFHGDYGVQNVTKFGPFGSLIIPGKDLFQSH